MTPRYCFALAILLAVSPMAAAAADNRGAGAAADSEQKVFRNWTDTQGRTLEATFRGVENGHVFLQVRNGYVYRLPLDKLAPADREVANRLKPEGLGIPADPGVAQAAARIDALVNAGLAKAGQKPNPLASDEQFVRRVYLDIAGRIPTRDETLHFLGDSSVSKRAKLIDMLLDSEGYKSATFNYLADMLRVTDQANKVRYYTYHDWLKDQIAANTPWDKMVHAMLTADGKLLGNGATGYLLRDAGMRLDNLSLTLSTFLGANVSCAQCHDHPFAEWTQKQFYEMAAFFGATETYGVRGNTGSSRQMYRQVLEALDDRRLQQQAKNIMRINAMAVEDTAHNDLKLPDDYKYKDGKPGDPVAPKLITWSDKDRQLKAYQAAKSPSKSAEQLREEFANWLTAPDNPRFAMTIANRLWKRAFGVGVKEPVADLDDVDASVNPALLHHLSAEMVRLKFDMKQFMRLLYNTQAYQREATSYAIDDSQPYHFPGPILRRMTAEQAWDSCATLVVGAEVEKFKVRRGEVYAKTMMLDLEGATAESIKTQIETAAMGMRQYAASGGAAKPGPKGAKRKRMMARQPAAPGSEDGEVAIAPPVRDGLVLARASELPQPERDQHFLRMFGQSDRQIADSNTDEGSIPQVMMLMNGDAQRVIASNGSTVLQDAAEAKGPEAQAESLYLSFFSRRPNEKELADCVAALGSGLTLRDLTWVLFNTREFVFIE